MFTPRKESWMTKKKTAMVAVNLLGGNGVGPKKGC